jgi:alpha-beta hydrolase superfamily lysophospholipase
MASHVAPDDVAIAPGSAARPRKAPSPVQERLEPGRGRLMVVMALSAGGAIRMTATLIGVARIAARLVTASSMPRRRSQRICRRRKRLNQAWVPSS